MQHNFLQKGTIGNVVLIVIGIILSAILVGLVTGKNRLLGTFTNGSPVVKEETKIECGLTVTSPKDGATVTFPLSIKGYVNGCGWVAQESIAGVVTLQDENSVIIATEALITDGDWKKLPVAFHTTIGAPWTTPTGTLNFINIDPSGENPKTKTVHFKF